MSNQTVNLPYQEFSSTLSRYSNSDQLQAHQYKSIIESELGQAYYQREFPTIGEAALGPLNANVPVENNKVGIIVDNKPVDVYKQFWQYKQNGGSIFTDWTSAGQANLNTDISVSEMPLFGEKDLQDRSLVLSNTNNVRNNLQRYGKEYLTTTNMLNAIAFDNGVSYRSGNISPIRTGSRTELQQIEHGNFGDKENGDLMSRQIKQLDVSLPINYANHTRSHWVYSNPSFIRPNEKLTVFHEKLKFGEFDLDSMKLTGDSCLTTNFNMTPKGFSEPVDVLNDRHNFPPVSNPDYYEKGSTYFQKEGIGSNMYCSANTNYVVMPKNHAYANLDTSFQVNPGQNSITLGTVMSPKLKEFIKNDLYNFNRSIILMQLYNQNVQDTDITSILERKYPSVFVKKLFKENNSGRPVSMYNYYINLSEDNKYKFIFNQQRNFASINQLNPEVEVFVNHLSIFKFSGHDINNPSEKGHVLIEELKTIIPADKKENGYLIDTPGCFLLLPTMLSEDIFAVRPNIPEKFAGSVSQINNSMMDSAKRNNLNYTPILNNPNECITHSDNFKLNATNCAFRDSAEKWIQKPNPNFVPNMFNDPNNYNNDISNLYNTYGGVNPYDAPLTF